MLVPILLTAVSLTAQAVSVRGTVWIGLTNQSRSEVSVCVSSWSMTADGGASILGETDVCEKGSRGFHFNLASGQEYLFQQPLRPSHLSATYELTVQVGGEPIVLRAKLKSPLLRSRQSAINGVSTAWEENKVTVTNKSNRALAVKAGERDDCTEIDRDKLLLLPGKVVSISTPARPSVLSVFDPEHPCKWVGAFRRP